MFFGFRNPIHGSISLHLIYVPMGRYYAIAEIGEYIDRYVHTQWLIRYQWQVQILFTHLINYIDQFQPSSSV